MAKKPHRRPITPIPRIHEVHNRSSTPQKIRTDYDQRLWPVPGKPVHVLRTAYDIAEEFINED